MRRGQGFSTPRHPVSVTSEVMCAAHLWERWPLLRHCERSEAIQGCGRDSRLLRCARNDDAEISRAHRTDRRASAIPRHDMPGLCNVRSPSSIRRAQGRPGAGRARGPPAQKNAGGRYHRFSRDRPALPARWSSRLYAGFLALGLLAAMRDNAFHALRGDTSVEVSEPCNFTSARASFVRTSKGHAASSRGHRSPPRVS